jgi:hypothetical protein
MIHAIVKIGSTEKSTPAPSPAPKKDKEEKKGKK